MSASVISDRPYERYVDAVHDLVTQPVTGFASAPAGRYRLDGDAFTPVPLAGCTVLAEPYPLDMVRAVLSRSSRSWPRPVQGLPGVPVDTLHLTVADLVAAVAYQSRGEEGIAEIRSRVADALHRHPLSDLPPASIAGVGVFPSTIVAVVSFPRATYKAIIRLRDDIYESLFYLGVARYRPFVGHVTLGYVEALVTPGAAAAPHREAESAVERAREVLIQQTALDPCEFPISGASLFEFPDMSRFARWPGDHGR